LNAQLALDIDPFSDEALDNPYPLHEQMRAAGAAIFLQKYGCYAISRYHEVRESLNNWQVFSSAGGTGLGDIRKPGAWRPGGPIVEVDPPDHTEVRRVLKKLLSPSVIRAWRDAFEAKANQLAAELLRKPQLDGVRDVAERYVFDVFPSVLGLKSTSNLSENLRLIGELNFEGMGPKNARFAAAELRIKPISAWYEASFQRENMMPGGFGEQIFLAADAGAYSPTIAPGLVRSFLRGGMDTTISTIANTLWLLALHPHQWAAVRADAALIPKAFEEAMRLETPIQSLFRTTTRQIDFHGTTIGPDKKVQIFLASANRDPGYWSEPNTFNVHRDTFGHVALGFGVHNCIGQMLARLEGEAILKALICRTSRIELDGPPERRINNNLRSLRKLPLRIWTA
jgi:4-methoxybenzoate monooxygenase (O-demethylating)